VTTPYDPQFYEEQHTGSLRSAKAIAPLVCEQFEVSSVVDVGCGVGTWLVAFADAGASDVLGLDGDYVDRSQLHIPAASFAAVDLTCPPALSRRFDLAISMEVAEHLDERYADGFIDFLTSLSDVVLFSAAIPGQGGVEHVNEQWQGYWAQKFAGHDFQPLDLVRPAVWNRSDVEWFYAQNTLVYVHRDVEPRITPHQMPLDVVHPRAWAWAHEHQPIPLRRIVTEAPLALGRALRLRLGR
jgi:SAM-dependent methyltransferase